MALRREFLLPETSARLMEAFRALGQDVLPLEERADSLRATLERVPEGRDVWVFGYGSLMWNPAFHHVETRAAREERSPIETRSRRNRHSRLDRRQPTAGLCESAPHKLRTRVLVATAHQQVWRSGETARSCRTAFATRGG